MRYPTLLLTGILLTGSFVLAAPDSPPTPVPVPQPAPLVPGPATQPATTAQPAPIAAVNTVPSAPAEGSSILVLPFSDTAGSGYPWLARAIQQDLMVDLVRATRARVMSAGGNPPAADTDAALQSARQAGATVVVSGQFQVSNGQVRVTGQVLDVASGRAIGGISATGQANDLFPLEDSVAGQALRALPAGWVTVSLPPLPTGSANSGGGQAAATPPPAPAGPPPDYYSYTYPDYSSSPGATYSYSYWGYPYDPYYWYAVPYYGPGFFFYGNFDHFHNHFWGHGWEHGFRGGFHGHEIHGFSHAPSFGGGHASHGGGGGGGHR